MFGPVAVDTGSTGPTAMTREADYTYDVSGATLPAVGKGDVTVGGTMYHVWKDGCALMGAVRRGHRLRHRPLCDQWQRQQRRHQHCALASVRMGIPFLSADGPDTAANEGGVSDKPHKTARSLPQDCHADYLVTAVKYNQPTMLDDLQHMLFEDCPCHATLDKQHGRIERRR